MYLQKIDITAQCSKMEFIICLFSRKNAPRFPCLTHLLINLVLSRTRVRNREAGVPPLLTRLDIYIASLPVIPNGALLRPLQPITERVKHLGWFPRPTISTFICEWITGRFNELRHLETNAGVHNQFSPQLFYAAPLLQWYTIHDECGPMTTDVRPFRSEFEDIDGFAPVVSFKECIVAQQRSRDVSQAEQLDLIDNPTQWRYATPVCSLRDVKYFTFRLSRVPTVGSGEFFVDVILPFLQRNDKIEEVTLSTFFLACCPDRERTHRALSRIHKELQFPTVRCLKFNSHERWQCLTQALSMNSCGCKGRQSNLRRIVELFPNLETLVIGPLRHINESETLSQLNVLLPRLKKLVLFQPGGRYSIMRSIANSQNLDVLFLYTGPIAMAQARRPNGLLDIISSNRSLRYLCIFTEINSPHELEYFPTMSDLQQMTRGWMDRKWKCVMFVNRMKMFNQVTVTSVTAHAEYGLQFHVENRVHVFYMIALLPHLYSIFWNELMNECQMAFRL